MSETFFGPDFQALQGQDPEIAAILISELDRQRENLQLIASENFTSPAVLAPLVQLFQINMLKAIQASAITEDAKRLIKLK